jgi:hypothetical protein
VLSLIAVALAAATPPPALDASAPWWEKITMTIDETGVERSCNYESSFLSNSSEGCDAPVSVRPESRGVKGKTAGVFSKLTFERRFSPGGRPNSGRLQPGDKLLAQQVMFLTIDPAGSVQGCRVVARSGDMLPNYGCNEAKAERFEAGASPESEPTRQAFMTVLVYGHTEQLA